MTQQLHNCAAEGCDRIIPMMLFMCIDHWRMVPVALRREVSAAAGDYRFAAQTHSQVKHYTAALRDVQQRAIAAVREKEIKRQVKKDSAGDTLNFG